MILSIVEQVQALLVAEVIIPSITALGVVFTGYISNLSKNKLTKNSDQFKQEFIDLKNEMGVKLTELSSNVDKIKSDLLELKLEVSLKVLNHKNLVEKMQETLRFYNFDESLTDLNEQFIGFFNNAIFTISDYYVTLNSHDKSLGYEEREVLVKDLINLAKIQHLKIDIDQFCKLTDDLLQEYNMKKTPDQKNLDLIADLFGLYLKKVYQLITKKVKK